MCTFNDASSVKKITKSGSFKNVHESFFPDFKTNKFKFKLEK